jgi:sugar lactone lactonase YvrE
MPNGVYQVSTATHSAQLLADLSTFFHNNPVSHPNAGDFEPDGVPYSMIEVNGDLYIVEPNHGRLLRVTTQGEIRQIVDFSATLGHMVPTSVVWEYGQFWVGNLGLFPITPQSESVYQLATKGCIVDHIAGFTAITGMASDGKGALYVLQFSTVAGNPSPGTGNLVRIVDGVAEVVLSGLIVPTAVTVGPDGAVYVSDLGATPTGRILRLVPPPIGQGTHLSGIEARMHVDSGACSFSPKAGPREDDPFKR